MEDAAALQYPTLSPNQLFLQHQELSINIQAHIAELYVWRTNWELANPSACYEVLNPSSSEHGELLFPSILHYSTLTAPCEVTTYNAILLLLLKLAYEIIGPGFNLSFRSPFTVRFPTLSYPLLSNPLYLPGHAPSPQAIATEICRSAQYHLLEEQSSAGAFYLLFPLRVAYQAFEDGDPEKVWLEALMERT
jgi:hypothetical protein